MVAVVSAIVIGLIDWYVIPAMGFSDTIKYLGLATEPAIGALVVLWVVRKTVCTELVLFPLTIGDDWECSCRFGQGLGCLELRLVMKLLERITDDEYRMFLNQNVELLEAFRELVEVV